MGHPALLQSALYLWAVGRAPCTSAEHEPASAWLWEPGGWGRHPQEQEKAVVSAPGSASVRGSWLGSARQQQLLAQEIAWPLLGPGQTRSGYAETPLTWGACCHPK